MNDPMFPVLHRRPEDFEWPYPTAADKLKRLFGFLLAGPRIKGIDVAPDYQKDEILDVQAMRNGGYHFAFVQVNRGLWAHPNLLEFCKPLLDAGFPIMTYALFYGTLSGEDQADFHLNKAWPIWQEQGKMLPAMLDIEVRDGVGVAVRVTHSEDWFRVVSQEVDVIKYCSPALNDELLGGFPLGNVIGHVAHWTSAVEPSIPTGWTKEKTLFWQYGVARKHTWCPPVPGMASDVDVNYFFGTLPELLALDRGAPYYSASASASPSPSMPIPSIPEEDMDLTKAKEAYRLLGEFIAENEGQPSLPSSSPSPSPSPSQAPQPDNVWTMTVKGDKAKTWTNFVWNETQGKLVEKKNAEGKPIMQEYFDKSGNRLLLIGGSKVDTYKTITDSDGTINHYKLFNRTGDREQPLYVAQPDVMKPY